VRAWTEERGRNSLRSQLWKDWVLGFVSGANTFNVNAELLERVDAPAIDAWVDNYCRSNPLENVYDAVVALVKELLSRTRQMGRP
jgi:hypothetical protein